MSMDKYGTHRIRFIIALLVMGGLGLTTRVWARGEGIKAGSGRLHFGADLELSFDSNPGYFPSGHNNSAFDLMLRARPLFSLDFPSEVVSFQLNGKVGYDYYFGLDNKRTTDLSTVTGEADLKLGINPNGQFSFFLIDTFSRSGDPRYTSLAGRFDRTGNEVKAQFQIKPGGGALMFDLAYAFYLDWYDKTLDEARAVSNYAHRAFFSGKWKFLPKTALSIDFDADIRRYFGDYSDGTSNPDVNGIRATLGLIGQISPSISIVVKAGYGDSLISSAAYTGSDYRSVVGQAEMTYQAATTMFQLGYSRNFQPVVLFGFFGQDRFYLRFRQQLAGRFTLSADAGFDLLDYGQPATAGVEARFDYFVSGGAAFEYHVLDWLSLALDYRFQALISAFQQPLAGSGGVDYNQHVATFRLGLDY